MRDGSVYAHQSGGVAVINAAKDRNIFVNVDSASERHLVRLFKHCWHRCIVSYGRINFVFNNTKNQICDLFH